MNEHNEPMKCKICGIEFTPSLEGLECPVCNPGIMLPGEVELYGEGITNEMLIDDWLEGNVDLSGFDLLIRGFRKLLPRHNRVRYELTKSERYFNECKKYTNNMKLLAEFRGIKLPPQAIWR